METSELHKKQNVIVIGAGISGLSAAYELDRAGYQVTVLESKHLAGGRMAEEMIGSFKNPTGAMGLNSYYTDMFDLCRELGIMDQVEKLGRFGTGTITDMKKTFPMTNNPSKLELLRHPGLSLKSKLKLASLLPDMQRARRIINPCLVHTAAAFDDESMSAYLIRKVGQDFLENVASPLFNVALAWNPDTISRAAFLAKVAHVTESNGYIFRDGIGTLTRLLASKLDVKLNTQVTQVTRSRQGSGRVVHFESGDTTGSMHADLVVFALPGDKVSALLQNMTSWERKFFSQGTPYAQYAMIVYVLNKPVEDPDGLYFIRNSPTPLNFYKTYAGDPDTPGHPPHLWVAFSPERLAHFFAEDGSDLIEKAKPYVKEFYPSLDEDVSETILQPVGQITRVRDFLLTQECGPKDVYYVGDYLAGPGTGNALAIGRRTGKLIADHWSGLNA
jgi:oxygen-dependent protoporphyrinogen oxidase